MKWRLGVGLLLSLYVALPGQNPNDVIINEIDGSGDPDYNNEAIELLVVNGPVDMRGWILREDTEGENITFANDNLWSSVATGTYVVVYVRSGATIVEDTDPSDKVIKVKVSGAYLTGSIAIGSKNEAFFLFKGSVSDANAIDGVNCGAAISNYYGLTVPDVGDGSFEYFSNGANFDNDNSAYWYDNSAGSRSLGSANPGQDDSSLPVELSLWEAKSQKGVVVLHWITESEIENLGFIINRKLLNLDKEWIKVADFQTNKSLRGQGSTTRRTDYTFIDDKVEVGRTYLYQLVDIDYSGTKTYHDIVYVTVLGEGASIKNVFPNPFNPTVNFFVTINEELPVTLRIYNLKGQLIRVLVDGYLSPGNYTFKWNGRSQDGKLVESGLYLAQLLDNSNKLLSLRKIIFIR